MTDLDNPYNNIIEAIYEMIADSIPTPWYIGEVVSPYPLAVNVAGMQLEREDMMFDKRLLARSGEVHFGCDYGDEDFNAGDKLLMMTSPDGQDFIAICKLQ